MHDDERPRGTNGDELRAELNVDVSPDQAFDLVCKVAKWPVWLSFVESARFANERRGIELGADVIVRSGLLGEGEQTFEIDEIEPAHRLSLVGAYSLRRRLEFTIERLREGSRLCVSLEYPKYGGSVGRVIDRVFVRRKLEAALVASVVHFKSLVEFDLRPESVLEDF
jgi:hypothetical protein